jgi:hypothetical protein
VLLGIVLLLSRCAEQNSLPPEIGSQIDNQSPSGTTKVGLVYNGEYLCDQAATGLSLQLLDEKIQNSTYGIFHFFPMLTNPNVPAGSFVVKGLFDEQRGLIDMQPVSWITRPFGFWAVGLRGTSTDRGETFEGQVTGDFFHAQHSL